MKGIIIYNKLGHKFANGKVLDLTEKDVEQINERNLAEFRTLINIGEGFSLLGYLLYTEVKIQVGIIKEWKLHQSIGTYDNSPEIALAYTYQALITAGYKGKVVFDYLHDASDKAYWEEGRCNFDVMMENPEPFIREVNEIIAKHEAYQ